MHATTTNQGFSAEVIENLHGFASNNEERKEDAKRRPQ
jgi:hypothetical protein